MQPMSKEDENNFDRCSSFSQRNFLYVCEEGANGVDIITRHHITTKKPSNHRFLLFFIFLMLLPVLFFISTLTFSGLHTSFFAALCLLVVILVLTKYKSCIRRETVVVMPTFGVQLETHYNSGKIVRLFVPMGDILAAVINDAVTPFTCYSYLALILRDQKNLVLVFKGLWPPLEMLLPTWTSLCNAIDKNVLSEKQENIT